MWLKDLKATIPIGALSAEIIINALEDYNYVVLPYSYDKRPFYLLERRLITTFCPQFVTEDGILSYPKTMSTTSSDYPKIKMEFNGIEIDLIDRALEFESLNMSEESIEYPENVRNVLARLGILIEKITDEWDLPDSIEDNLEAANTILDFRNQRA